MQINILEIIKIMAYLSDQLFKDAHAKTLSFIDINDIVVLNDLDYVIRIIDIDKSNNNNYIFIGNYLYNDKIHKIRFVINNIQEIYFNDNFLNPHSTPLSYNVNSLPSKDDLLKVKYNNTVEICSNNEYFLVRIQDISFNNNNYLESECIGLIMSHLKNKHKYNFLNFVYFKIKNIISIINNENICVNMN